MQFKQGVSVATSQGQDVGRIERIVIDPQSRALTHVVVRKGLLFTKDKVVPVDLIAAATKDGITLREDAGDLQALPDFEEKHQVMANQERQEKEQALPPASVPALDWYPSGAATRVSYPTGSSRQAYITETQRNIPDGTVALKGHAKVVSSDDKRVGNIDQVLTHQRSDQVTHFLISQGLLVKENKLIPAQWVNQIDEDEVRLAVATHLLDELREHRR